MQDLFGGGGLNGAYLLDPQTVIRDAALNQLFGGKTGTAQVASKQANLKDKEHKDNAWFVGFAPYRNPEIVVAAFTENGGWGAEAAAPVAHAVLDTYYKKKIGQFDGKTTTIAQK